MLPETVNVALDEIRPSKGDVLYSIREEATKTLLERAETVDRVEVEEADASELAFERANDRLEAECPGLRVESIEEVLEILYLIGDTSELALDAMLALDENDARELVT